MTGEALLFDDVSRRYGAVRALEGLSLTVRRGEMFGMIGPDGAGKTTAIRLACGLLRPDGGVVRTLGRDPLRERRAVTGGVGYLSQRFSLYGDLSIDENLAFQAEIHGMRRYGAARDRLLEMTQLTPFRGRRADRLSGGMKQKLALACTLIHEPDLLLLDEPTTGVDPVSRREFWKLLSDFLAQGLTIVMTTPYLDEAERCGRVALVHEGRVLAIDDPAALQAAMPGTLLEVIVEGARPPVAVLAAIPGVADVQVFGDGAHVRLDAAGGDGAAVSEALLRQGLGPVSVRTVPASLEDVFIHLVTAARNLAGPAIRALLLAIVAAGIASPPDAAFGQDAPRPLTLEEVIRLADEQSLRLAELRARADGAEAALAARQAADRPLVALQGGYTRTNHVDEFAIALPTGQTRLLYPDVPDNYRARLDLQWPIYTAGRVRALEEAAGAERDAARLDVAAARADVRLEAIRAFWALVTAEETRGVLEGALRSADAHLSQLRAQEEQGLIPPNEVLTAQAQRARQRVAAIEAENLRGIAEADLRRAIGDESRRRLEPAAPSGGAAPAPGAEIAALAAHAREHRPERRALAARREAAREREAAAAAAGRPQVSLGAGYDYARPNPRIFPRLDAWRESWDVSVNVGWSLWDGGRRRAEEAEAAAATRALAARAAEFDRQLAFDVDQRALDLKSAYAGIDAAEEGVIAAVEARRVLGERFAAGVATNAEVLDADTAVLQAALDRTRAVANARLAAARLDRAVGR